MLPVTTIDIDGEQWEIQDAALRQIVSDLPQYIKNQNKLSDYEDVTFPLTAQYDGFLTVVVGTGANQFGTISVNDIPIARCSGISNTREYGAANSVTIPLNKNDVVTVVGAQFNAKARYYKSRDYPND